MPYINCTDSRVNRVIKKDRMELINQIIGDAALPQGWQRQYHPSSTSMFDNRRKIVIKVSVEGNVDIDRRNSKGEIKSVRYGFDDCVQAASHALTYVK